MRRRVRMLSGISIAMIAISGCYSASPDPVTTTEPGSAATDQPNITDQDATTTTTEAPTTTIAPTTTMPPVAEPPTATNSALDPTGQTIPATNYSIPSGAIFMAPNGNDANAGTKSAPVQSIRRAISLAPSGGTIVMRGGEHRTWYSNSAGTSYDIVAKSLTIQAYPNEQPWFNGADVVSSWTNAGNNRWTTPWSTPAFCDGKYYSAAPTTQNSNNTGPCSHVDMVKDPANPLAGDPQMVFVNGVNLRQVSSVAEVNANTFHYDWTKKVLTVGVNPAGRTIEATARPIAMVLGNNKDYTLRGIGFHRYASNEYSNLTGGAVYIGGNKSVIENVVFSHNAGTALTLSTPRPGSRITKSVFAFNGALGVGANGSSRAGTRNDMVIEESVFSNNNSEKFGLGCNASCAAGNIKLAHMVGFTVKKSIIENAQGPEGMGVWCDLDCSDGVIVNNLVRNNGKHGIFYEVSRGGIIASNLVVNNADKGIMLGSATTKVYNNTIITNQDLSWKAQGIMTYDDPRWPGNPSDVGPNTSGVEMVNNIISGAKGVLMLATDGTASVSTKAGDFFTAFNNNAYHHNAGENFINWSNSNPSVGKYFKNVVDFSAHTAWDKKGIDVAGGADPFFVNKASGDYRVRKGSVADNTGAPLPSDVANAIGVSAGSVVSRGALSWPTPSW
ncbi:MAG: right-handed parallel beta-helix repeat-containing protein [Microthrixaceae bacterium]|nr:right-handed parallel beta-helix repeat-containing protein [Microthrixaceae bacterium]